MGRLRHLFGAAALLLAAAGPASALAQGAAPSPAAPAPAPDPEKLAIAREIVDIALPPERRHAMIVQMTETMMAQAREAMARATGGVAEPELQRIVDRALDRIRAVNSDLYRDGAPAMFEAIARAYARLFDRDQLLQVRAFARTPAGTFYFQHASDVLADPDVAESNRAQMTRAFEAMQPVLADAGREIQAWAARQRPRRR